MISGLAYDIDYVDFEADDEAKFENNKPGTELASPEEFNDASCESVLLERRASMSRRLGVDYGAPDIPEEGEDEVEVAKEGASVNASAGSNPSSPNNNNVNNSRASVESIGKESSSRTSRNS